jgi:hypothetical protein
MLLLLVLGCIALLIILSLFFIPIRAVVTAGWARGSGYALLQASWGFIGARMRREGRETRVEYLFLGRPFYTRTGEDRGTTPRAPPESARGPLPILSRIRLLLRLIRPFSSFGGKLLRAITLQEFRAQLRVGLRDPASTGQLYGCFCAFRPLLVRDRVSVEVRPVFDRQLFEGEIMARLRIDRPLLLMVATAMLFLDPDVRGSMTLLRGD